MVHGRLPALGAFAAVIWLAVALAPAQDKKDPQDKFEPRSAPGAGQKYLARFVGDWDVVKTFHPRGGSKPVVQNGECKQEMIQGGRFLQSSFTFRQGETKTTGQGLVGFEASSGAFTTVWIDSRRTAMSFRKSKDKFDGEQIVLYGTSLGQAKEGRMSKTVSKLEDDGKKIVHRQYTVGADGKERLMMELVLTRKK